MSNSHHIIDMLCMQYCNQGKDSALNAVVSDNFRCFHWSEPDGAPLTVEQFNEKMHRLFDAFPGMHYQVDDVIEQGDRIAVRWSSTGTWQNDYNGEIPATGEAVALAGVFIMKVNQDGIETMWVFDNVLHVITAA